MPEEPQELSRNEPDDSDAVLLAFTYARAAAPGDKTLLREWAAKYPALAGELITVDHARFAAGLTLTKTLEDGPEDPEMATISAGILAARRKARERPLLTETRLTSLLDEAKARGLSAPQLARTLRLDRLLLGRLEQRALDTATVPLALVRQLGQVLGRSADEVALFLRGETRLPAQAHFYARKAPSVQSAPAPAPLSRRSSASPAPLPSFAEAVQSSRALSAGDKAYWEAETAAGVLGEVFSGQQDL